MKSKPYLIAIVGSYDPARAEKLKLRNYELAPQAGQQLGQALAEKGFHIIVYGSYPHLLDVDVVRGYTSVVESEPDCIHVYFSQNSGQPKFDDLPQDDVRFRFQADRNENCEVSFYQSIANIDGMILLGGGPSALIAGIVAISHKKPIVICADFGGEAKKVWDALSNNMIPTEDEVSRMGNAWTANSADKMITILENQIKRVDYQMAITAAAEGERINNLLKAYVESQRRADIHLAAAFIALLLALGVFSLTLAQPAFGSTYWQVLVFFTAALTGISGSTGTVLLEELSPTHKQKPRRITSTMGLGAIAGTASVGLFLLAQVFINPENTTSLAQPGLYQRLFMFTIVIGLIAGLTFEAVFKRLRDIDVVQTGGLQIGSTMSSTVISSNDGVSSTRIP